MHPTGFHAKLKPGQIVEGTFVILIGISDLCPLSDTFFYESTIKTIDYRMFIK